MGNKFSGGGNGGFIAYRILRHSEYGQVVEFKPRTLAFGKSRECAIKTLFTEEELISRIEALKIKGEDASLFEYALRDLVVLKR